MLIESNVGYRYLPTEHPAKCVERNARMYSGVVVQY